MLLGQVLEVSLGERDLGSKDELVACMSAEFTSSPRSGGLVDCRVVRVIAP